MFHKDEVTKQHKQSWVSFCFAWTKYRDQRPAGVRFLVWRAQTCPVKLILNDVDDYWPTWLGCQGGSTVKREILKGRFKCEFYPSEASPHPVGWWEAFTKYHCALWQVSLSPSDESMGSSHPEKQHHDILPKHNGKSLQDLLWPRYFNLLFFS